MADRVVLTLGTTRLGQIERAIVSTPLPLAPVVHKDHPDDLAEFMRLTVLDPRVKMLETNVMEVRGVLPWASGLVKAAEDVGGWKGVPAQARQFDLLHLSEQPRFARWQGLIHQAIGEVVKAWEAENPFIMGVMEKVGHDVSRTIFKLGHGDGYKLHVDSGKGFEPHRAVTLMGCLRGDGEGGEIRFPRQRLTLEIEPGVLLSWPAGPTYPYEIRPVRSGFLYLLTGWLV